MEASQTSISLACSSKHGSRQYQAENIVNGLKKAGVYPFDPTRVLALEKEKCDHSNNSTNNGGNPEDDSSDSDNNGDAGGDSFLSDNDDPLDGEDPSESHLMDNGLDYLGDLFCDENLNQSDSFNEVSSAEQEALYQRRLEEGYDLFDSSYLSWLEKFHPEAVPVDWYTLTWPQQ